MPLTLSVSGKKKQNNFDEEDQPECEDCFEAFFESKVQLYFCRYCGVLVCRACKSRVNGAYHAHFINIFGCPRIIHGDVVQYMTPLWNILYLTFMPLIASKYTVDFMLAFFDDVIVENMIK